MGLRQVLFFGRVHQGDGKILKLEGVIRLAHQAPGLRQHLVFVPLLFEHLHIFPRLTQILLSSLLLHLLLQTKLPVYP